MNDTPPTHDRRFNPNNRSRLTDPDRLERWKPLRKLEQAGMRPGMKVLELGCGPGFWTAPISQIITPQGQIAALDVSREMLLSTLSHLDQPGRITAIQGEMPGIPILDGWAEFLWLAFIFHEVDHPEALAKELYRVAAHGARTAVFDWQKIKQSNDGPPSAHRFAADEVLSYLDSAGFINITIRWQDPDAYLITADRAGGSHPAVI